MRCTLVFCNERLMNVAESVKAGLTHFEREEGNVRVASRPYAEAFPSIDYQHHFVLVDLSLLSVLYSLYYTRLVSVI